jgi:hypothetical protein
MRKLHRAAVSGLAAAGIGFGVAQPLEASNGTKSSIKGDYEACAQTLPSHESVSKVISRACQGQVDLQDTVFSYQNKEGVTMYALPSADVVLSQEPNALAELGPNNDMADYMAAMFGGIALAAIYLGLGDLLPDRRRPSIPAPKQGNLSAA